MTKQPPKKYEAAVDHASDLDRKYFEANPDAAQYQHTPESIKQLLAEKPINSKKRMKRRRRG